MQCLISLKRRSEEHTFKFKMTISRHESLFIFTAETQNFKKKMKKMQSSLFESPSLPKFA